MNLMTAKERTLRSAPIMISLIWVRARSAAMLDLAGVAHVVQGCARWMASNLRFCRRAANEEGLAIAADHLVRLCWG